MEVVQYSYWSRCSSLTKQLFKSCTNWKQENWLHFLLSLSFSELTLLAFWKFTHGFHLNSTCWSNRNLTFSWKWYKGPVLFSRLPIWQQPLLCIRHLHSSFIFFIKLFKKYAKSLLAYAIIHFLGPDSLASLTRWYLPTAWSYYVKTLQTMQKGSMKKIMSTEYFLGICWEYPYISPLTDCMHRGRKQGYGICSQCTHQKKHKVKSPRWPSICRALTFL